MISSPRAIGSEIPSICDLVQRGVQPRNQSAQQQSGRHRDADPHRQEPVQRRELAPPLRDACRLAVTSVMSEARNGVRVHAQQHRQARSASGTTA